MFCLCIIISKGLFMKSIIDYEEYIMGRLLTNLNTNEADPTKSSNF